MNRNLLTAKSINRFFSPHSFFRKTRDTRVLPHFHALVHLQGGLTALMCAAENGLANCVRLLLDAGADSEAQSNVSRRSLLFNCAFS